MVPVVSMETPNSTSTIGIKSVSFDALTICIEIAGAKKPMPQIQTTKIVKSYTQGNTHADFSCP